MHFILRFVLASALVMSWASAVLSSEAVDLSDHPWIGEAAPGFDLETVSGGTLSLEELRGQYVVIHFGASW